MGDAPPPPIAAPSAAPPPARCAHHSDRAAVGRCPACRRLVCDECHVRLDGILHCKACLQERARTLTRPERRGVLGTIGASVAAVAALFVAFVVVRGALTAAGILGGHATRHFAVTFESRPAERR